MACSRNEADLKNMLGGGRCSISGSSDEGSRGLGLGRSHLSRFCQFAAPGSLVQGAGASPAELLSSELCFSLP